MHNDEVGIVTRSGARRLRWLAIAVAVPLFGVVAAFGTVAHVPEPVPVRTVVETLALSTTPVGDSGTRSEEHTSELQSHVNLVCRLLLEKKKNFVSRLWL